MSGSKDDRSERLQAFAAGPYERPNQPFTCGQACEGIQCLLGPTPSGTCQADTECLPITKKGRWICNRSADRGGKCDLGPSPEGECCRPVPICSPLPSLRLRRGRFVRWCAMAAVGLVLLTLAAPWRDRVLKPGDLTQQHAQILSKQNPSSNHCSACHGAGELGLSQWTVAAITPRKVLSATQSEKCLDCHGEKMPAATATLPHGVSAEITETMTLATCERLGIRTPKTMAAAPSGKLACSTCHREHHGAQFNLSAVTNSQCASCHQDEFSEFATSHPEFDQWPYRRRTRIAFDHASHMAKHFPSSKVLDPNSLEMISADFDCRSCHLQSSGGSIVSVVSFEQACASCHDEKIQQSFGDGLTLLQLPMIDVSALRQEKLQVGEWPQDASQDFEGELPSLTRALLGSDPFARSALEQFGAGFDFLDVDPSSIDDLEAVHDIVWGIKYLVYDMVKEGPPALARRLEKALDMQLDESTAQRLTGHISPEAIHQLQRAWFPNLMDEVAARRKNRPLPKLSRNAEQVKVTNQFDIGWVRDDTEFAIRFRPAGHGSEFLTNWINTVAGTNRTTLSEDFSLLWKQLSSSTSNGLCISCHSVDPDTEEFGLKIVNWNGRQPASHSKPFTEFSHDPHIILPGLQDCTACHEMDEEASPADNYRQSDPFVFESNFKSISKSSCAACHNPSHESAGDNCIQCHNYHVDSPR